MDNLSRPISRKGYAGFISEEPEKLKVILFTTKKTTPPMLRALSTEFKDKISFGEIRKTQAKLSRLFDIEKYPTLMILSQPDIHIGVKYDGELKRKAISKWLRGYIHRSASGGKIKPNPGDMMIFDKKTYD